MRVHQLLPSLAKGDAVSNNAFALHALLKGWGYDSELYSLLADPRIKTHRKGSDELDPGADDLTIYHYSIGCQPVSERFLKVRGKKMLIYHNITPEHFFESYDKKLFKLLKEGREALGMFKDVVQLAVGDSDYNVQELREVGYREPKTLPILLDMAPLFGARVDRAMARYLNGDELTTFLFTGRIAPNKKQEDVIRTFAHYHHKINKASQLILVGGATLPKYLKMIKGEAEALGVRDYVIIPDHVSFPELRACYGAADLFLSMSEHEGFCVPLLEAMHFGLPILAFKSTGVESTLGNSGVFFTQKDHASVAEMAHLMITDQALRGRIIDQQRTRLSDFEPAKIAAQFKSMIGELEAYRG